MSISHSCNIGYPRPSRVHGRGSPVVAVVVQFSLSSRCGESHEVLRRTNLSVRQQLAGRSVIRRWDETDFSVYLFAPLLPLTGETVNAHRKAHATLGSPSEHSHSSSWLEERFSLFELLLGKNVFLSEEEKEVALWAQVFQWTGWNVRTDCVASTQIVFWNVHNNPVHEVPVGLAKY